MTDVVFRFLIVYAQAAAGSVPKLAAAPTKLSILPKITQNFPK
jgi:hypothetical protein